MSLDPIHVTVVVERPPTEAFELFTDRVGTWWPLADFSVGGQDAASASIDGGTGEVFERDADGNKTEWGRVLTWEPPVRLAVSWHPGLDPETPTDWDATFEPEGEGATRLSLVHSGWERLADDPEGARERHRAGWARILDAYTDAARAESARAQGAPPD